MAFEEKKHKRNNSSAGFSVCKAVSTPASSSRMLNVFSTLKPTLNITSCENGIRVLN